MVAKGSAKRIGGSVVGGFLFPHGSEVFTNPTYKTQLRFAVDGYRYLKLRAKHHKRRGGWKDRKQVVQQRSRKQLLSVFSLTLPRGVLRLNLYYRLKFRLFCGMLRERLGNYSIGDRQNQSKFVFSRWINFYLKKRWVDPGVFE